MDEPSPAGDTSSEPQAGAAEPLPGAPGSPQQAIAVALQQLAGAARVFAGLDARLKSDRALLQRALESLDAALGAAGVLALDVRPGGFALGEELVYGEADPERSLAQRLHQDGVRRLTLRAGLDGEELLRLLEALSSRFTRLDPREDDLVGLMRWAGLPHVELDVEPPLVPLADEQSATGLLPELSFARPALPTPATPKWVDPPAERLDALRAEVSPGHLTADCRRLAHELRRTLLDPDQQLGVLALGQVFAELRDYLLHEERLDDLLAYAALLRELLEQPEPPWDPGRTTLLRGLLASLGAKRQVRKLLRSMSREQRHAPQIVVAALEQLCADPLAAVAAVLPDERQAGVRVAARQVLEYYGVRRLPELQSRFLAAKGQLASDLLRAMAGLSDEAAIAFVVQQANHPEEGVQDEALWHISRMPYSNPVGRALLQAFRQTTRERRARILDLIVRTHDRRFVDLLARHVDEHAADLTSDEAAGIGRVIGTLGGEASMARWKNWLQPRANGARGFEGPLARQVAGLLALAEIPGEEAAEALGEAFDQADDSAQPWVLGALAQRQRLSARKPA